MDDDSKYWTTKFHPLANIFPMMTDAGMEALAADIRAHGLRQPIEMWGGAIIDGRNRSLACEMAGVKSVHFDVDFPDEATALHYVVSKNLFRRHLTADQRADIARQLSTMKPGDNQHTRSGTGAGPPGRSGPGTGPISQADAAAALQVSERSVRNAKVVYERGSPSLQAAVKAGEIGLREAAEQVRGQERDEDEPQPVRSADIGAGMRKLQQQADTADLDRMKLLWGNLSAANRSTFFDGTVRPWLDEMEREDAIERM
jgi:hypothetical protein